MRERRVMTMEYREISRANLKLSTIGFGVWTIAAGWWGDYSEEEATALLRAAYDNGITFFNTGNVYGDDGWGEKLVAKALADVRENIVIGTTFGYDVDAPRATSGHAERPQNWSVEAVKRSLDRSLQNLGVDCIDVWQLHNPRMDGLQNEALWALLADFKTQGLIKAVGPSMGPAIGWRDEGVWALENLDIDFFHHIYNMFEQEPGSEFTDLAAEKDVAVLVRVPHSSGLLEDKYTLETKFDASDHRSHRSREWLVDGLHKVDQLRSMLEARPGVTMGQLALKWLLADPAVTSVQPNFYSLDQITEFAAATDVADLNAGEMGDIDLMYRAGFGLDSQRELAGV